MEADSNTDTVDVSKDMAATGPFSVLWHAVKTGTQVLVFLRNSHKLLARVKAYDRHFNMILEDVKEVWKEASQTGKGKAKTKARIRDRTINKMFLRGDCVILVMKNPEAA